MPRFAAVSPVSEMDARPDPISSSALTTPAADRRQAHLACHVCAGSGTPRGVATQADPPAPEDQILQTPQLALGRRGSCIWVCSRRVSRTRLPGPHPRSHTHWVIAPVKVNKDFPLPLFSVILRVQACSRLPHGGDGVALFIMI